MMISYYANPYAGQSHRLHVKTLQAKPTRSRLYQPFQKDAAVLYFSGGTKKGVYLSVWPDEETKRKLADYIQQNHIPNPVPLDKLHATIMASPEPVGKKYSLRK